LTRLHPPLGLPSASVTGPPPPLAGFQAAIAADPPPSYDEQHKTLPPFGDWRVPNLPLRSPVLHDPSLTVVGHRQISPSLEPHRPKPPPPPHRRPITSVSRSILLLARRQPEPPSCSPGEPHTSSERATAPPRVQARHGDRAHVVPLAWAGRPASASPLGWAGVARSWAKFWPNTIHSFSFFQILMFIYKF
jgi:hypothetical protein